MQAMSTQQPGEPGDPARSSRRLAEPPSARYADRDRSGTLGAARAGLVGPLLRAIVAAVVGAAMLVLMAAILASTFGLLIVSGATGAAIGLLMARARVQSGETPPALSPSAAIWLAVALTLAAVAGADIATWLIARGEGGTLGLVDYLLTTFELVIPAEAVVAALAAAWGAAAGPVQH